MAKKHALLGAVFVLVIISFWGEWIDAAKFSFASYSYFLVALYTARCYLLSVLAIGLLALCKPVTLFVETSFFLPVIAGGVLVLCRVPFNALMRYSRVVTVAQVAAAIVFFARAMARLVGQRTASGAGTTNGAESALGAGATGQAEITLSAGTSGLGTGTARLDEPGFVSTSLTNPPAASPVTAPALSDISAPAFEKLSKREKEVAALLLEGKKNDEIAEALFISGATVKSHIQNIFKKYEVRNRMEFAAKAHKR